MRAFVSMSFRAFKVVYFKGEVTVTRKKERKQGNKRETGREKEKSTRNKERRKKIRNKKRQ